MTIPRRDLVQRSMRRAIRRFGSRSLRRVHPRLAEEFNDERVVFRRLHERGFFGGFRGGRILEVGPKHGEDSRLLAGLGPSELVMVDLPWKRELVDSWLAGIAGPKRYVEANLLDYSDLGDLGSFEIVWCTGVLYHTVEQARLVRILWELTQPGGRMVIESAVSSGKGVRDPNLVRIHWPHLYRGIPTITHRPTRTAIKSWMEMAGFEDAAVVDVYTRATARRRAVLAGTRGAWRDRRF